MVSTRKAALDKEVDAEKLYEPAEAVALMKKLANAWNGRFQVYDAAFDEVDAAGLSAAVARNVLADADRAHADGLAAWTLACLAVLAATPVADVLAGRIPWPNPEPFAAAPATAPITPLATGSPA